MAVENAKETDLPAPTFPLRVKVWHSGAYSNREKVGGLTDEKRPGIRPVPGGKISMRKGFTSM